MDLQLHDKTALVTASTGGIGRALAESLLREGAHVIINGRSQETVDAALKELKKISEKVDGAVADLGSSTGCRELIDQVKRSVDILINNFGIYETVDFFDTDDTLWTKFFESNVMSGVRLSRYYMKPMLEKNWGRILFVSSESGLNIPEEMIHYGMTKTAQLAVMRGLAKLTKGTRVTVNAILPGPTRTEGVKHFLKTMADQRNVSQEEVETLVINELRPTSLIQRLADCEEVAPLTTLLCSPLSSATNGSAVKVEGGIVDQLM
jgi:NAD(P)-dependent dehydrogenase (short-subunit alcohol dehydrogenase family)